MWNIEKIISKGDYDYAKVPNHPNTTINGYILHHRVVIENSLGRILEPYEIVHHINKNKKDNRLENLEILNITVHSKLHGLQNGRKFVKLKCPNCGIIFDKPHNSTHLSKSNQKFSTCSPRCRGQLSRFIQLNGITHKVDKAISENVIEIYKKFNIDNSEHSI